MNFPYRIIFDKGAYFAGIRTVGSELGVFAFLTSDVLDA
jgi:hypothetical protein